MTLIKIILTSIILIFLTMVFYLGGGIIFIPLLFPAIFTLAEIRRIDRLIPSSHPQMSKEEIEKIVFHPHMIRIFFYLVLPILSVQTFLTYEYSGLVPDRMSAGPLLGKFMDIASEARNIILANNRYLIDMLGLPEMLDRTPLKIRTPQGPLILFNYEGLFLLQIIAVPTMVCGFISSIIILSIKGFREKIYKWNPREEEKNLHIAKGIFIILFIFSLLIVTQYFIFSLPPYSYVQNLIISGAALYTSAIVNVLFPFVRIKVI